MFQKNNGAHLAAINKRQALMQKPNTMEACYENKKNEFDDLPDE